MMTTQNWDWIFHTLGWGLAGLGVLLALWALFWDHSRGRKRCPKCWYSMEGAVPNDAGVLICPECGKEISNPRSLNATKRRPIVGVVGLIVFPVSGHVLSSVPQIKERGWVAGVPSTVMIAATPWVFFDDPDIGGWSQASLQPSWRNELYAELIEHRIADETLWGWQSRWLTERCIRQLHANPLGDLSRFETLLRIVMENAPPTSPELNRLFDEIMFVSLNTRDQWVSETPFHGSYQVSAPNRFYERRVTFTPDDERLKPWSKTATDFMMWGSCFPPPWYEWIDGTETFFALPLGVGAVPMTVRVETRNSDSADFEYLREFRHTLEIESVPSADGLLQAVELPNVLRTFCAGYAPVLHRVASGNCFLQFEPDLKALLDNQLTLGAQIVVLCNGEPAYTGEAWWAANETEIRVMLTPLGDSVPLERVSTWAGPVPYLTPVWSVRLTGDPVVALRNFDADRYWCGQVEFPIRWGEPNPRIFQFVEATGSGPSDGLPEGN